MSYLADLLFPPSLKFGDNHLFFNVWKTSEWIKQRKLSTHLWKSKFWSPHLSPISSVTFFSRRIKTRIYFKNRFFSPTSFAVNHVTLDLNEERDGDEHRIMHRIARWSKIFFGFSDLALKIITLVASIHREDSYSKLGPIKSLKPRRAFVTLWYFACLRQKKANFRLFLGVFFMHLSRMTKMRPEMQFRDAALGILSPKFSWFI